MGGGASEQEKSLPEVASDSPDNRPKATNIKETNGNTYGNQKYSAKKQKDRSKTQTRTQQKYGEKNQQSQRKNMKKQSKSSAGQFSKQLFAKCINGNESTMVCLSSRCRQHPFYCLQCPSKCEQAHFHGSKIVSVGIRQFQNKVLKYPTISPVLQSSIESYKEALYNLQELVNQYVEDELQEIQSIGKIQDLSQEAEQFKKKAQNGQFIGMKGHHMARLWMSENTSQLEKEKAQYLQDKKAKMLQFSDCFRMISQEYEIEEQEQEPAAQESQPQPEMQEDAKKPKRPVHKFQRYKLYEDGSLGKEVSWSSSRI